MKQAHLWGLDVTGSIHGGGGIGGLLFTKIGSASYFPIYDGRGNVTGMIDAASTNGNIVAGYQYGAFGELQAAVRVSNGVMG